MFMLGLRTALGYSTGRGVGGVRDHCGCKTLALITMHNDPRSLLN